MLISYRQPLGYRRPLRVGRVRYCRLWLDHHTIRFRAEVRPVWQALSAAAAEICWVVQLTARSAADRFERGQPRPWSDERLFWVVLVVAVGAVAAASLLGVALAEWVASGSGDVLPAAGGALMVGAALFALMYLVFAAKEQEPRTEER